ncbi:MAG TPA: SRPBCC domain-containing protein [Candidatus Angelobacter sp.]|jgi:uncharacterized protein YndB with AHSA1/START domain
MLLGVRLPNGAAVLPPATKTANSLQLRTIVSATPEAVWSAFTDPVHLIRWFPLQASVMPGVAGILTLMWDEICSAWRISAWQPGRFLQVEELLAFASKNEKLPAKARPGLTGWRILLEPDSGSRTLVDLEHFGLGGSPEIFPIVARGWEFELLSLRYYLERQFGKDRSTIWLKKNLECEAGCEAEIWKALVDAPSALPQTLGLEHVEIEESPWQFAATLAEPGSCLFRVKIERLNQNQIQVNLWLAAYNSSPAELRRLRADFEQRLDQFKLGLYATSSSSNHSIAAPVRES